VSLVFNGKDAGRVSPQMRGLIHAAAAELGYRVNTTASALARGQLEAIGFVGPDPTNPFFSMVLEGLTQGLRSAFSLTVLMPEDGEDYNLTTVQRALAGNLAGLVLATPGTEFLDSFVPTCPTVVLDAGGRAGPLPSVDLDVRSAILEMSGYLAALGHGASRTSGSAGRKRSPCSTAGRNSRPGCWVTAHVSPSTISCSTG
jgi:DNA-binding LacI/PurR family transcriptional regulator